MLMTFDYLHPDWLEFTFCLSQLRVLCSSHYHGFYETSRMCQILLQGRQGLLADHL